MGLSKKGDDFVPTKMTQIADSMDLSPIIPEHIRRQLSQSVDHMEVDEKSDSEQLPPILSLCRNLSLDDNTEEHKEQQHQ